MVVNKDQKGFENRKFIPKEKAEKEKYHWFR